MSAFRLIHSSDLHLGRRFGAMPEDARGRLVEARHGAIDRLARAARDRGAAHVLLAGDTFDSETPSDPVWRQALAAMARAGDLRWWLLPGNHDSLAAESLWERVTRQAPENVVALTRAEAPVALAPGVVLLPAPLTRRRPGRDLTAWMDGAESAPGVLRVGLAHGAVRAFGAHGEGAEEVVAPDRARRAGLDYLALGDWHGPMEVCPRSWYSGTPERDAFKHRGRGACLAVTLPGRGAAPLIERVEIGAFHWSEEALALGPEGDPAAALDAALPPFEARRDALVRLRASGRAGLSRRDALRRAHREAEPDFCHLALIETGLATELDAGAADLDAIAAGGALRGAAEALRDEALDAALADHERKVASEALGRLYAWAREMGGRAEAGT